MSTFRRLKDLLLESLQNSLLENELNSVLIYSKPLFLPPKQCGSGKVVINNIEQVVNKSFQNNVIFCCKVLELSDEDGSLLVDGAKDHDLKECIYSYYIERENMFTCLEIMFKSSSGSEVMKRNLLDLLQDGLITKLLNAMISIISTL